MNKMSFSNDMENHFKKDPKGSFKGFAVVVLSLLTTVMIVGKGDPKMINLYPFINNTEYQFLIVFLVGTLITAFWYYVFQQEQIRKDIATYADKGYTKEQFILGAILVHGGLSMFVGFLSALFWG